jgi:hypothetical protein
MKYFLKLQRVNFCTSESKNLFFRYQNIEYKAIIPKDTKRSLQEFLDIFGNEKGNSSKDFEVFKKDKYINLNTMINDIPTKSQEEYPLTVVDDKLTTKNVKNRKLINLKDPLSIHSAIFQQFLNEFIQADSAKASDIDTEGILRYYKTMSKVTSTDTKFMNLLLLLTKSVGVKFEAAYTLGLEEFNKHDETELLLIKSSNGLQIPITMVLNDGGAKENDFNEGILHNLNVMRKMCMKNKTDLAFGVVTDLYKWKFTYYQKPIDMLIESENNFLLSLKYELSITNAHLNIHSLLYILKIINGLSTVDVSKINFHNIEKRHIL